jgi:hypothetical protein
LELLFIEIDPLMAIPFIFLIAFILSLLAAIAFEQECMVQSPLYSPWSWSIMGNLILLFLSFIIVGLAYFIIRLSEMFVW